MPQYNQTPENRCMPLSEWPAHDLAAWRAALQPAEFLEDGGAAANLSDSGRKMIVDGYGFWLSWLAWTGQLDKATSPGRRVTRDAARAYLASMEPRLAAMTIQGRIRQLGRAMRAMAPEDDWRWLFKAADRLRSKAVAVREKRSRMQEVNLLVDLGVDLMRRAASSDDHFALSRAVLYRDGLMLSLLALRPYRRRTFSALSIGKHLVQRHGGWWIDIYPEDNKTKRHDSAPFPEDLVEALNVYLREHRPVLLQNKSKKLKAAKSSALWIAKGGQQMGDSAISVQLSRHTKAAFGRSVNLHLFRDCAATSIAIHDPAHICSVQAILGHGRIETSERYYNQAQGIEASRRFQKNLAEMEKGLQEG